MTAHPVRYFQARTSMAFRRGSFGRRGDKISGSSSPLSTSKASTTRNAAATAAAPSVAVAGNIMVLGEEDPQAEATHATSSASSSDMMQLVDGKLSNGDGDGYVRGGSSAAAVGTDAYTSSKFWFRRVLSSPRTRGASSMSVVDNDVSDARGPTAEPLDGLAPPGEEHGAFESHIQQQHVQQHLNLGEQARGRRKIRPVASMDELSMVMGETAYDPRQSATQELRYGSYSPPSSTASHPHDRVEDERDFRATSMALCFTPLNFGEGRGGQGPSKRARSGAEPLPKAAAEQHHHRAATSGMMGGCGGGDNDVWASTVHYGRDMMAFSTPLDTSSAVDHSRQNATRSGGDSIKKDGVEEAEGGDVWGRAAAAVAAAAGVSSDGVTGTECAASGRSDPADGGGGVQLPSPPPPPATNEAWLASLEPLMCGVPPDTHPEDFLHEILRKRGYRTDMVPGTGSAFHRPPSPEQVAAYDKAILRAVLDEDESTLESMRSSGTRMDACNRFGDTVLHMACRRGRVRSLRYLLRECGGRGLEFTDDFGRTVMHDACWTSTPRFDVASMLLARDTRLLRILDKRGSSPLQYVPRAQWAQWCAFFESRKEVYWPPLPPGQEDVAGIIPLDTDVVPTSTQQGSSWAA